MLEFQRDNVAIRLKKNEKLNYVIISKNIDAIIINY